MSVMIHVSPHLSDQAIEAFQEISDTSQLLSQGLVRTRAINHHNHHTHWRICLINVLIFSRKIKILGKKIHIYQSDNLINKI